MLKQLAKKYQVTSDNKSDQNYVVLYRKSDSEPWSIDNHTYFPKEKAQSIKNTYKSKGYQDVKIAFALIEDEHYT